MVSVGSSPLAASVLAMRAQVLAQNAALRAATAAPTEPTRTNVAPPPPLVDAPGGAAATTGFGAVMRDALGQVNELQARAGAASADYDRGRTDDIAAVMMARQEASVGFEATLQVRNKLVSAYTDIMNMPL